MTDWTLIVIALAVIAGSMVQGTVGLGLGLVAAPVVTLLEPGLMPGALLILGMILPALTLLTERTGIDWHGIGWSTPARLLGTIAGVWLVANAGPSVIGVIVAIMVLVAIAVSLGTTWLPITRSTLSVAGFVSGATGTATAIGGPPMALLYQHRDPLEVRPTMAVFFTTGAGFALVLLAVSGELSTRQVGTGLALIPALAIGAALAIPIRRRVDQERFRRGVLVVCACSALILLARSLAL